MIFSRSFRFGMYCLPFAVIALEVLLAPHTKVEESFNVQAMHDLLYIGAVTDDGGASQYDHLTFSGVVPRTFLGALFVSSIAAPFVRLVDYYRAWGGTHRCDLFNALPALFICRLVLGFAVAAAIVFFGQSLQHHVSVRWQSNVRKTPSKAPVPSGTSDDADSKEHTSDNDEAAPAWVHWVGPTFCLLVAASQPHVMYYGSRPLPNTFALLLVTFGAALYLRLTASAEVRRKASGDRTKIVKINAQGSASLLWIAGLTFVIFRGDLAAWIAPLGLLLVATQQVSLLGGLWTGIKSVVVGIAMSALVDSYFWGSNQSKSALERDVHVGGGAASASSWFEGIPVGKLFVTLFQRLQRHPTYLQSVVPTLHSALHTVQLLLVQVGVPSAWISRYSTMLDNVAVVWPEGEVLYYNVVRNQSHLWGSEPPLWYFKAALVKGLLSTYPLVIMLLVRGLIVAAWDNITESRRSRVRGIDLAATRELLTLSLSAVACVALLSLLPHKELRFILPIFPILAAPVAVWVASKLPFVGDTGRTNRPMKKLAAAPPAEGTQTTKASVAPPKRTSSSSSKNRIFGRMLLLIYLFISVGVSIGCHAMMVYANRLGYPGAEALLQLHEVSLHRRGGEERPATIFIDAFAGMTGVSRFHKLRPMCLDRDQQRKEKTTTTTLPRRVSYTKDEVGMNLTRYGEMVFHSGSKDLELPKLPTFDWLVVRQEDVAFHTDPKNALRVAMNASLVPLYKPAPMPKMTFQTFGTLQPKRFAGLVMLSVKDPAFWKATIASIKAASENTLQLPWRAYAERALKEPLMVVNDVRDWLAHVDRQVQDRLIDLGVLELQPFLAVLQRHA